MRMLVAPRWRKPAWLVLAGAIFSAAWLVRGGPLWWVAILTMVLVLARAVVLYRLGAADNDLGAVAGSRTDERQQQISRHSWALSAKVSMITAFLGVTIAVALKADWWWPFLVIYVVTGMGYLFGWSTYGVGEEVPGDDDRASYQASPV